MAIGTSEGSISVYNAENLQVSNVGLGVIQNFRQFHEHTKRTLETRGYGLYTL